MISFFKFWRLRRIALELAQGVGNEAWKAMPRICEESEKAVEVLKSTREGSRVLDGVAIVMAFGVHVVDHYARNFLDEGDRRQLVRKMLSRLLLEATRELAAFPANEGGAITARALKGGETFLWELMRGVVDRLEQCDLLHLGGPESREESGRTSLNMCGIMLMSAFTEDCDVPKSKTQTWEEMEPKTLKLYDTGRAIAWEVHQRVQKNLYRLLEANGFQQIREVGVVLRV